MITERHPILLLLVCLFLSGCGGSNWLVGKWVFDKDRSIQAASKVEHDPEDGKGETLLKEIAGGVEKGISHVRFNSYEGLAVEFTATETRRIQGGEEEVETYEILKKEDPQTCIVQYADGSLVTWNRTETGLRSKVSGKGGTWIYFRSAH